MADMNREAFNKLLNGVEVGALELGSDEELPEGVKEIVSESEESHSGTVQDKRNWLYSRLMKLMEQIPTEKGLMEDGNFHPTSAILIMWDEGTNNIANINVGFNSAAEMVYYLEDMKLSLMRRS